jgi:Tol biopolymer transport system component
MLAVGGLLLLTSSTRAAPWQLLSARNAAGTLPSGGNGNSAAPSMSSDGRFILFVSSANNLVPGGDSRFSLNLFLRDRASNTTVLVSVNTNGIGGNGSSMGGMVSTNGRWVAFESDATDLVPGDTNEATDIFVRDLQTGSNVLVSVALGGSPANGASTDPSMTPDGRYVAFTSDATNLVANDSNGIPDVFVRDLVNHTTTLVSVGAVKSPLTVSPVLIIPTGPAAITPDGRFVAFYSPARGMVAGVLSSSAGEVYLRDLVASNTLWASSNAVAIGQFIPATGNFLSYHPTLSDDGRFVAFKTSSSSVLRTAAILKYDSISKSLLLVATNTLPQMDNDDVYGPEMTPDGRYIAFAAGIPTNRFVSSSSVFLADTQTGSNSLVSVRLDGTAATNNASHTPVLSPDGRFVAFLSNATNLVGNVISNGYHIYLRDMAASNTVLIDTDTNGEGVSEQYGNVPSLSADGRWVAFASPDGSLFANDQNQALDVFVRDVIGGTNELISQRDATIVPVTGSGLSSAAQLSMTPNGRWVVFSSLAEDLVTNDFNKGQDVFVRDLMQGTTTLASVGLDGNSDAGGYSATPLISSNGQFVVFASTATNLMPNYTNLLGDVFERDLVAGTNKLVSVSSDGVNPGNGSSTAPAMSRDGRYVAFLSTAKNLVSPPIVSSGKYTFWRDTVLGVTVALSTNGSAVFPPSISADGRYVAFCSPPANTATVWDSQTLSNIYVTPFSGVNGVRTAVISPNGAGLLYQANNAVKVSDVLLQSNVFSLYSTASVQGQAQWSANGRFVTFVARSNTSVGPFGHNQVYLGDSLAGTVALVSATPDHSTGGNGISDSPTLSGDGRFVVYRSSATDIASDTVSGSSLVVYDRATGSNSVINPGTGAEWTSWASRPLMDAAGQTVTFQSAQSVLSAGDLNRVPDIFAGQLAVALDSDADGIPDWWMIKYFGHATGSAGDHSQLQDDADGDGFSNLQEFLTGSDPLNAASFLQIQISPADSVSQTAALTWLAVAGKSYQVQYKTNLEDAAWVNFGSPVVATSSISLSVPLTSTSGFYRVIAIN